MPVLNRHQQEQGGVMVKVASLCLTNHEGVWGSGCIDPHFLDLGTNWCWVVSFTPRPLYPRGKSPRYPLDRRLNGPQSRSGRRGEEKILSKAPYLQQTLNLLRDHFMWCETANLNAYLVINNKLFLAPHSNSFPASSALRYNSSKHSGYYMYHLQ
jgi:hypothetical protein